MDIKGIKYIAPMFDNSGYAKASRGNILALHRLGVPLTLFPISFEKTHPDLGQDGEILRSLVNKPIDYNIVIIHSTPEFWSKFRETNKVNIGYTIWETTRLHPTWPDYINTNVQKVLVGCEWNVKVFKDSGVTVPIGVVPHGIDMNLYKQPIEKYQIAGVNPDAYVFYSIFQWQERKNPAGLLKAYWFAFQNNENVALVLKTHRASYDESEKNAIRESIKSIKQSIKFDKYPPVYYISDMLSEYEMRCLHARGDCYVSLDRGEGFGLGPFEAGASGNPIIVTGFGGITEFAHEDTAFIVDCSFTPVSNMPWSPWYRGDQLWAEPNIYHASQKLQYVYNNRNEAKCLGKKLQSYIAGRFTWEHIGKKIVAEVEGL